MATKVAIYIIIYIIALIVVDVNTKNILKDL